MVKRCDVCNSELIIGVNCDTARGIRCRIPGNTKKKSPCQISVHMEIVKEGRQNLKKAGKSYDDYKKSPIQKNKPAIRLCIGRMCAEKSDEERKFLSTSPHNRVCDKCKTSHEGASTKGLSRIGAGIKISDLDFNNW